MITRGQLERFHQAAKMIETDGVEAYHSVSRKFGSDIAAALVIAFMRRSYGSLETYPPREEVMTKTNQFLTDYGLVEGRGKI